MGSKRIRVQTLRPNELENHDRLGSAATFRLAGRLVKGGLRLVRLGPQFACKKACLSELLHAASIQLTLRRLLMERQRSQKRFFKTKWFVIMLFGNE